MRRGLYKGRGAYTWSNTSGKENVGLSAGREIGGEVGYDQGDCYFNHNLFDFQF